MRSIEFLREYSPEAGPMTDAEYAAQQAQGQKNLAAVKGVGQKIASAFQGNNQAAAPAASANPYQGADAAKFAAMSPADQAFYTKGGGKPDINDPNIAMRAPNKGKSAAAQNIGAGALASTSSAEQSSAVPSAPPSMRAGALASTSSAEQSSAVPAAAPAAPEANPDADYGAGKGVAAAPEANPDADYGAGAEPAAAAPVPASNPTDARLQAGTQTAPTGAAAPSQYTDKVLPANLAPATAQAIAKLNGIADINKIRAGQILKMPNGSTYTVKPGDTLGKIAANPMQSATPMAASTPVTKVPPMPDPNRKTGTIAQSTEWMTKYGKTHNMDGTPKLAQAATPAAPEKPAAPLKPGLGSSPMRQGATPAKPAAPAKPAVTPAPSGQLSDINAAESAAPSKPKLVQNTFEESVDLMRRLSTMLKG